MFVVVFVQLYRLCNLLVTIAFTIVGSLIKLSVAHLILLKNRVVAKRKRLSTRVRSFTQLKFPNYFKAIKSNLTTYICFRNSISINLKRFLVNHFRTKYFNGHTVNRWINSFDPVFCLPVSVLRAEFEPLILRLSDGPLCMC